MPDNCNDRYLTKIVVTFKRYLPGFNLDKVERYTSGSLEFNKIAPDQIEITGIGDLEEASEHLRKQKNYLELLNSLADDALEISCLYKEAYDSCDGCD